ncbi:WhiB family transcriptional regulator [Streptomyces sp. NPDC060223]|uniref:WhiB family transcriptional regulator n=1 Tax=unclassified Streptomyces TaxID=2593676 RepID=UPI0036267D07
MTTRAPDTLEPAGQWVKQGACRVEPDAMFPGSTVLEIEHAKSYCRACPVIEACAQWALDTREEYGVWGGLSETERRSLLRSKQRWGLNNAALAARIAKARRPPRDQTPEPSTLAEIVAARTSQLEGGHLAWTGPKKLHFGGQVYTHKQACYIADRGHFPDGQVTSDCGITRCVLPGHLISVGERTQWAASRAGVAA